MKFDHKQIYDYAEKKLLVALNFSHAIQMSASGPVHYGRTGAIVENKSAGMLEDEPEFLDLEIGNGMAAIATLLSVDLRRSTSYLSRHGHKPTYLSLHTYVATMAKLVQKAKGSIVGFRGDGLIAAFGVTDVESEETYESNKALSDSVGVAANCGKAMTEAMDTVINPLLEKYDIPGEHAAGVGIDYGDIVITRIGIANAHEVTVIGTPINRAVELHDGENEVKISDRAKKMFPSGQGGIVTFFPRIGYSSVIYPDYYRAIVNTPNLPTNTSSRRLGHKNPR